MSIFYICLRNFGKPVFRVFWKNILSLNQNVSSTIPDIFSAEPWSGQPLEQSWCRILIRWFSSWFIRGRLVRRLLGLPLEMVGSWLDSVGQFRQFSNGKFAQCANAVGTRLWNHKECFCYCHSFSVLFFIYKCISDISAVFVHILCLLLYRLPLGLGALVGRDW